MVELNERVVNNAKGVPISHLYSLAEEIQRDCADYSVEEVGAKNMRFFGDTCGIRYTDTNSFTHTSPLSRYALGQLCGKLGVPINYIEKCINNGMPDLASDNINSWLEDYGKNLFIREYDNKVRGVLSDRFSVLDTPDIVTILDGVLPSEQYIVKEHFISPERFHARIIQKDKMKIAGEDLFAGVQIDSSDVGRSNLTVAFFIYKQICTNGLCIAKGKGTLFQQKHIGIAEKEFAEGLSRSLNDIPLLVQEAEEFIAFSSRSKLDIGDLKDRDTVTMRKFIENLRYKTRLSEESAGKVIDLMQTRYEPTQWGLINSITEVAQDFTLERRIELERIAGDMLSGVA